MTPQKPPGGRRRRAGMTRGPARGVKGAVGHRSVAARSLRRPAGLDWARPAARRPVRERTGQSTAGPNDEPECQDPRGNEAASPRAGLRWPDNLIEFLAGNSSSDLNLPTVTQNAINQRKDPSNLSSGVDCEGIGLVGDRGTGIAWAYECHAWGTPQ